MRDDNEKITTTDAGIPASGDEFSLTIGCDGPILLQDHYLIQKMAPRVASCLESAGITAPPEDDR